VKTKRWARMAGQAEALPLVRPNFGRRSVHVPHHPITVARGRGTFFSLFGAGRFESVHYRILYAGDRCTDLFIASDRIDLIEMIMLMTLYMYPYLRLLERLARPRGRVE
jgi:hypothetical protein